MWTLLRKSLWFREVVQLWIISVGLLAAFTIDYVNGDRVWPNRDIALACAFIVFANIVVLFLAIWDGGRRAG